MRNNWKSVYGDASSVRKAQRVEALLTNSIGSIHFMSNKIITHNDTITNRKLVHVLEAHRLEALLTSSIWSIHLMSNTIIANIVYMPNIITHTLVSIWKLAHVLEAHRVEALLTNSVWSTHVMSKTLLLIWFKWLISLLILWFPCGS